MKETHEDSDRAWYSEKFAEMNRKGLPLIPYGHLKQYKLYLDAFELHLSNDRKSMKRALELYTESLKQAQPIIMQLNDMAIQQNYSVNVWRLQALENIEMILSQAENSS